MSFSPLRAVLLLAVLTPCVVLAQSDRTTRTFDTSAFSSVSVGHGFTFELSEGEASLVIEARASDFERLDVRVEEGELFVTSEDWRSTPDGVVVRASTEAWERIEGGGGARVVATFDGSPDVTIDLGGGAGMEASGYVQHATLMFAGGVRFDARNLQADEVRLASSGGGRILLPSSLYFQPDASSNDVRVYTTELVDPDIPDPYVYRARSIRTIGSGTEVAAVRDVTDFSEVFVGERIDATIEVGPDFGVTVRAYDNLIEYLVTYVRDGRLYVFAREPLRTRTGLSASITLPSLAYLEVGPDASVAATGIAAKRFEFNAAPRSEVTLAGYTEEVEASLDVSASLEARDLRSDRVTVQGQNESRAAVAPQSAVEAFLYFNTEVCYTGTPNVVQKNGPGVDFAKLIPCE